jgi:hypothetical protein
MVKYVRGSQDDRWHWCENCTQYPMYVYQKSSIRPPNLCEQCKTKEDNGICKFEGLSRIQEPRLKREIPVLSDANFEA